MNMVFLEREKVLDLIRLWGQGCIDEGTVTDSDAVVELLDELYGMPAYVPNPGYTFGPVGNLPEYEVFK